VADSVEQASHPAGGPGWIQPELQRKIAWRDGDVVISVPAKSGTTWTMNIVHQLLTGGTADFRDIYEEVPWIEFVGYPGQPHEEILARLEAMPKGRRRAFKSHSAPPALPFIEGPSQPQVKYVVVFRNPEEALVSAKPFFEKHTDEWFALWGMPSNAMSAPDFATFYRNVVSAQGMHERMFFGFLNAWWPLRDKPNVLFLHYSDMKRDHGGSIRQIAEFLEIEPTPEQWARILEYTSFPWMKRHEDKFEAITAGKVPILQRGAMVRKGEAGSARADGMTDEIAQDLRTVGERACPDAGALAWYYEGGERG
jgi:hypothetical protein